MYRPTVRYDDVYRDYIDELFHATNLDRNQLIRGALFAAAHSNEFRELLKPNLKGDVPLPSPSWRLDQAEYWREQSVKTKREGADVNVIDGGKSQGTETTRGTIRHRGTEPEQIRRQQSEPRQSRPIPTERITVKEQGGIKISFY